MRRPARFQSAKSILVYGFVYFSATIKKYILYQYPYLKPAAVQKLLTLFLILSTTLAHAQTVDSVHVNGTILYYQKVESVSANKGLLIFLHGGVSQFESLEGPIESSIQELIEHNEAFVPAFTNAGYDLIFPVAFGEYNWLHESGLQFIQAIHDQHADVYPKTILSGFSDGGTGAYRIFYTHPEWFDGVLIFNGYPQLNNFHRKVDPAKITHKSIIYSSTLSDKRIPYEFSLIEYRRQKITNGNTFFSLTPGSHTFSAYAKEGFEKFIRALETEPPTMEPDSILVYPPVDGWIENGVVIELYPFRKKSGKRYGMTKEAYQRTDYKYREWSKLLAKGVEITLLPVKVSNKNLHTKQQITFKMILNGEEKSINLNNWLLLKAWD